MGYTHYWYQKRDLTNKEWEQFQSFVDQILEQLPQTTSQVQSRYREATSFDSEDLPICLDKRIVDDLNKSGNFFLAFNGFSPENTQFEGLDLSHEDACFYKNRVRPKWQNQYNLKLQEDTQNDDEEEDDGIFECCKTARKPYDFAVQALLIAYKKAAGENNIKISSDGYWQEWMSAISFINDVFDWNVKLSDVFDSEFLEHISDNDAQQILHYESPTPFMMSKKERVDLDLNLNLKQASNKRFKKI